MTGNSFTSNYMNIAYIAMSIAAVLALGYGVYRTVTAYQILAEKSEAQEMRIGDLESKLTAKTHENEQLAEALQNEQKRNEEFQEQIEEIEDTVGVLDKLSKTDPELLQKYSKVYFLNEHYMPEKLVKLSDAYLVNKSREEYFHREAWPYLEDLIEAAEDDGINLRIISAFRSYDSQRELKGAYTVTYGSGANTFSADQGYSEHQLGTTVDFSTLELGTNYGAIESTEAYKWLTENAHRFGFALSYPKNNAYYIFEPWHWRFVGKDLARKLDRENKAFYDLDQREIDPYLISIFD